MKRLLSRLTAVITLGVVFALSLAIVSAQEMVTVTLSPTPGQQGSGTATLTAVSPTTTQVQISVSGLTPNASLSNHIHSGDCPTPGGFLMSLSNLNTDANGNASATTTLNVPLSDLSGLTIITPHVPAGGTPELCGDIPTVTAAATPAMTPAAATPAMTPVAATPVATPMAAVLPQAGGIPLALAPALLTSALAVGVGFLLRRR